MDGRRPTTSKPPPPPVPASLHATHTPPPPTHGSFCANVTHSRPISATVPGVQSAIRYAAERLSTTNRNRAVARARKPPPLPRWWGDWSATRLCRWRGEGRDGPPGTRPAQSEPGSRRWSVRGGCVVRCCVQSLVVLIAVQCGVGECVVPGERSFWRREFPSLGECCWRVLVPCRREIYVTLNCVHRPAGARYRLLWSDAAWK